jgi:naphthoate synthase/2-ketocyclohexanecarboxyl-CoA hydrolase
LDFQDIVYEVKDRVATIRINRPEVLNAFRIKTIEEMTQAFDMADADKAVRVVVLTGTGDRSFSTGGDVDMESEFDGNAGRHVGRLLIRLAEAIRGTGKPVIAKIRGWCVGGGNELNLLCDLSVATQTSRFAHTDARLGNSPIWYATQLLPLHMSDKRAREVVMLGKTYTADDAERLGWINEVVDDDKLDAVVEDWCMRLLASSPQSLRLSKVSMNQMSDMMLHSVRQGFETLAYIHDTDEFHEGTAAFLEKRPPKF